MIFVVAFSASLRLNEAKKLAGNTSILLANKASWRAQQIYSALKKTAQALQEADAAGSLGSPDPSGAAARKAQPGQDKHAPYFAFCEKALEAAQNALARQSPSWQGKTFSDKPFAILGAEGVPLCPQSWPGWNAPAALAPSFSVANPKSAGEPFLFSAPVVLGGQTYWLAAQAGQDKLLETEGDPGSSDDAQSASLRFYPYADDLKSSDSIAEGAPVDQDPASGQALPRQSSPWPEQDAFYSRSPVAGTEYWAHVGYPAQQAYLEWRTGIYLQSAFLLLFCALAMRGGASLAKNFEFATKKLVRMAKIAGFSEKEPEPTHILEIDQGLHQLFKWRNLRRTAISEAKMWHAAASGSSTGMAVVRYMPETAQAHILLANPSFLSLCAFSHYCPGINLFSMRDGTLLADEALIEELRACFRHGFKAEREIEGANERGDYIYALCACHPLPNDFETPCEGDCAASARSYFVLTIDDLTEVRLREIQLAKQATTDALTGLPNRQLFTDRLVQTIELAERNKQNAAVALIDIDRFKMINDTMGHEFGDALIRSAAGRIASKMRPGDTLCRLGGDEFGIVIGGQSLGFEDISLFIEKIREAFDEPFILSGQSIEVTCSMGVALFPEDGADPGTLVKRADIAMFRAKDSGRGAAQFFSHEMRVAFEERMTMEQELKGAIRRGEIQIHYQPKVRAKDGVACGMEALARWKHPVMGWVPPSKFIPLAEESGIIGLIGREAMRIAIRDAKALWDLGFRNMPVAVNVSSRQISSQFLCEIQEMLRESGLPPKMLHAEITESLIMPDSDEAASFLNELSSIGIGVALDDFGTGWSSLAILKRLPLNYLKIDKSFVEGLGQDPNDEAITAAIVNMSKALGLQVIAEGVETQLQKKRLEALGADILQGYLVCKAKPLDSIVSWLRDGCPFEGPGA